MADQIKALKVMSPKGRAIYPKLDAPDYKFDAAGSYSVKLSVPADEVEETTAKLQVMLDEFVVAKKAELRAAAKDKKGLAVAEKKIAAFDVAEIFKDDLNDEGEPNGNVIMSFKMKASGVVKKTGKAFTRKPSVFDAKGKKLDPCPPVWGGSILKVSGDALPYYMASTNGVGITMYLSGVQIIDLKSGGNRDAADFGFGEEEGFTASEPTGSEFSDESAGDGAPSGDGDF